MNEYMRMADRMYDLENQMKQLEKENAELKESCDETQELLDKQIEVTYKLDKENEELKAGKNANEGEIYELSMKITELQELLTDCLFYCYHVDPYYHDCLEEDNIFTRAEKLGVKYNV